VNSQKIRGAIEEKIEQAYAFGNWDSTSTTSITDHWYNFWKISRSPKEDQIDRNLGYYSG
jgi:hypothetical protein